MPAHNNSTNINRVNSESEHILRKNELVPDMEGHTVKKYKDLLHNNHNCACLHVNVLALQKVLLYDARCVA